MVSLARGNDDGSDEPYGWWWWLEIMLVVMVSFLDGGRGEPVGDDGRHDSYYLW